LRNDETSRPVVKKRRLAATNKVFDVFLDHLVGPPDREVIDFLVVQPKHMHASGVTGVSVLASVDDKFALVDCFRHPLGQMSLETPKGFIDAGESPDQAAIRELTEETGLSCSPTDLVRLGTVAPEPGVINGQIALFAAINCSGKLRVDPDEIGLFAVRLLSRAEIEIAIAQKRILDAVTLLLLNLYRPTERADGANRS
jgi:8-oxo-dGTP pyrophosphatase MutT (NUDIX family)